MPTKRTKRTRNRRTVTLAALGFDAHFALSTSWRPGGNLCGGGPAPWETWADFLADWVAVRDEIALEPEGHPAAGHPSNFFGRPADQCFAEFLLRRYGPDGPGALDEMEIAYSPYPGVKKQPKYLVEFWEWRAARDETRG